MAKKDAAPEFNMSEEIRDILHTNPQATAKETVEALQTKFPQATINKNSFAVAFYTGRKKLGISVSGRRRRARATGAAVSPARSGAGSHIDIGTLMSAAKFVSEVGGVEAALEAIKQVQAVQVR